MNKSMIECTFRVTAELGMGEEVRVSGPAPTLGSSDPDRSIPLVCTPSSYPFWSTKNSIFLPGEPVTVYYRYCVFSGGKFLRWEGNGNITRTLDSQRPDTSSILRATSDVLDAVPDDTPGNVPSSPSHQVGSPAIIVGENHAFKSKQFTTWGRRSQLHQRVDSKDRVIIVSYFLPVILTKIDGKWNAAWNHENVLALSLSNSSAEKLAWVGTVRYNGAPIPVEEEMAVSNLLIAMNCYPVFVNHIMHHQFYEIFCKQHLWLLLHHVADVYGPLNQSDIGAKGQQDLWFAYSTVNRLFRDKVVEVYQGSALVWIHGFHLMLLPSFLRRFLTIAKIGYFFHTPFPSSEIWRTMSRREDLLRGILAADQVGFHLYEYARHFVTTCHRLLGHGTDMNINGQLAISVDDREVVITCIHVGVDLSRVKNLLHMSQFETGAMVWRRKFQDKLIVASVDRLERLKGIPLKLKAIDEFLTDNEFYRGKVLFSIIGISALERSDDYKVTTHDVRVMVDKLNQKYAVGKNDVVVYFEERNEKEFQLPARLCYFAAADILMITATRDGLNRFPMEFTLAQNSKSTSLILNQGPMKGLIIISEFISSARVMRGALTVNPWRTDLVNAALLTAFKMSTKELQDRFRRNMEFSTRLTTSSWALHVLNDLKAVEKSANPSECMTVGFGMGYKVMNIRAGFQAMDMSVVSRAYRNARSRLIVLDWGGTLVSDDDKSDRFQAYAVATGQATLRGPSEELAEHLTRLASDLRNYVFVISGKELLAVSENFGNINNLGLGAEHGFYYRWPRDEKCASHSTMHDSAQPFEMKSKWQTLSAIEDHTWKDSAQLVMNIFVQRTHGTYIEKKGNALIWQYRDADPEFGYLQSKELEEHLKEVLAVHKEVEVIRGGGVADGYIEVRPRGVSKGRFLERAMEILVQLGKPASFVLAVGDDSSDEAMFEYIQALEQDNPTTTAIGATVGKKPSAASTFLDDPSSVMELISTMNRSTQRENRYYSALDLPSQANHRPQHVVGGDDDFGDLECVNGRQGSVQFHSNFDDKKAPRKSLTSQNPPNRAMSMGNLHVSTSAPLARTTSTTHLNMTSYLDSINDNDEDDAGIFF